MTSGATTVLAVRGDDHEVGVEARCVLRVVSRSEWEGPLPVALERLVYGAVDAAMTAHVLVMESAAGEWAISTARELVMRELPSSEVHALPTLVWPPRLVPLVHAIAARPESLPLLVLDLPELSARASAYQRQGETP